MARLRHCPEPPAFRPGSGFRKTDDTAMGSDEHRLKRAMRRLSDGDMRKFVESYAEEDSRFLSRVLAEGEAGVEKSRRSDYRLAVRESIKTASKRDGFIGYWAAHHAVRGAEIIMEKAKRLVNQKEFDEAIGIYEVVVEELVKAIRHADDSNGSIGSAIGEAFQGLETCASFVEDEKTKKELFGYLLKESGKEPYEGWDWKWDFLEIAALIAGDDAKQAKLFEALDVFSQSSGETVWDRYGNERALEIKLKVFLKRGLHDEAARLIQDNLKFPAVRRIALENAAKSGDWQMVKGLAEKGFEQSDKEGLPGLTIDWMGWRLKAAQKEKNISDVVLYTRKLFVLTGDFQHYDALKKLVDPSGWALEVDSLVRALASTNRGYGETIPQIYLRENQKDKLLEHIQRHSKWAGTLRQYHPHLVKEYPQELANMYEEVIRKMLVNSQGRALYQEACDLIQQMKKCGIPAKVEKLASYLREKYSNRPAFLEELHRAGF